MSEYSGTSELHILIVEDHPSVRNGLILLIEEQLRRDSARDLKFNFHGVATKSEAEAYFIERQPDLVILDVTLKGGENGFDLLRTLRARFPELKVLMISSHEERQYGERALRGGAQGYLEKGAAPDLFGEAVRRVLFDNKTAFSDEVTNHMVRRYVGQEAKEREGIADLSPRQQEIFVLLGKGKSTEEIAAALNLSPKSVQKHRKKMRSRLGLSNQRELVREAMMHDLSVK